MRMWVGGAPEIYSSTKPHPLPPTTPPWTETEITMSSPCEALTSPRIGEAELAADEGGVEVRGEQRGGKAEAGSACSLT